MSLFEELKATCPETWRAYVEHAFVRGLGDGTLPEAAFRHYLIQDYHFLVQFARAFALAGYKARTPEDLRRAKDGMAAILDEELALHIGYCREWGLDEPTVLASEEAPACLAYTRYVLETGMAGTLLDLHVALTPCMLGYAEIARWLQAQPWLVREGNPYRPWIEMYAGADFQAAAADESAYIDRLVEREAPSSARCAELARVFSEATRLEADFWQMGLDAAG